MLKYKNNNKDDAIIIDATREGTTKSRNSKKIEMQNPTPEITKIHP
jgi:hypothetical protein